jgi:hypothetical protein
MANPSVLETVDRVGEDWLQAEIAVQREVLPVTSPNMNYGQWIQGARASSALGATR